MAAKVVYNVECIHGIICKPECGLRNHLFMNMVTKIASFLTSALHYSVILTCPICHAFHDSFNVTS